MKKQKQPLPFLQSGSNIIDTHCHLDMDAYRDDLPDVLDRAETAGIKGILTIGIDLPSSRAAVELASRHDLLRAAIGTHPHDARNMTDADLDALIQLADNEQVVGYGEIGLDYAKEYSNPTRQRKVFGRQLAVARQLDLPIIIHDREAHTDCLEIIKAEGPFDKSGVMHCFSGNLAFAKKVLDTNLFISIPGIVTFKNAPELHEVAKKMPLEYMLLETDGPFLSPVPFRGRRNEPAYTLYTAAAIAELRGITIDEVARQTTINAQKLFNTSFS
ncbi:MAG: hydrolase TatD [Proteobacteria bacterium]|nr:MAG: hydrolase TatD [Pseudomonadota bacterium]